MALCYKWNTVRCGKQEHLHSLLGANLARSSREALLSFWWFGADLMHIL